MQERENPHFLCNWNQNKVGPNFSRCLLCLQIIFRWTNLLWWSIQPYSGWIISGTFLNKGNRIGAAELDETSIFTPGNQLEDIIFVCNQGVTVFYNNNPTPEKSFFCCSTWLAIAWPVLLKNWGHIWKHRTWTGHGLKMSQVIFWKKSLDPKSFEDIYPVWLESNGII